MMTDEQSPRFCYNGYTPSSTRPWADTVQLERYLNAVKSEAFVFSTRFLNDSTMRLWYMHTTHQFSEHMLNEARSGRISMDKAHKAAQLARNEIMRSARHQLSEIGYAYSISKKEVGMTLDQLYAKYSNTLFNKDFRLLSMHEKDEVLKEIVRASGRSSMFDNRLASILGAAGKTLLLATVLISGYNIINANNKLKQAVKEGTTLIAAAAGGIGGGAIAGLVCGPGVLICSTVGVFLGSISFWLSSEVMFNKVFIFWQ